MLARAKQDPPHSRQFHAPLRDPHPVHTSSSNSSKSRGLERGARGEGEGQDVKEEYAAVTTQVRGRMGEKKGVWVIWG